MIDNNSLIDIVDIVTDPNAKLFLAKLFKGKKVKLPRSIETLIEPTKEFKGVITDFVVNEFFPTNAETELFIKIVYNAFNVTINNYCKVKNIPDNKIFFVYKGGNILRFIAYQIMYELGGVVSDIINTNYKDAFKKSDADFSIYIDPRLPNYDNVFIDMNNLAFLVQNELRNEFMLHPNKYFKYYDLNDEKKTEILKSYLEKLNNTENVKQKKYDYDGLFTKIVFENITAPNNCISSTYVPKSDFFVDFDNEYDLFIAKEKASKPTYVNKLKPLYEAKLHNLKLKELSTKQKDIYENTKHHTLMISSNQTLDFWKQNNRVVFSLVRTKVILNAYFQNANGLTIPMKIDGELIDVSIPHKDDTTILHYFENVAKNSTTYHIKTDTENFPFKAPSLQYLIEDIEKILFTDNIYPWNDVKYAKRLRRVLFMYFVMLLSDTKINYNEKVAYMKKIQTDIINKLNDSNVPNQAIDDFLRTHKESDPFWILVNNAKQMFTHSDIDKSKLQDYTKVISDNIDVLISLIPNITKKCQTQGLSQERITEGNTMWGGNNDYDDDYYREKYLKYKNKYVKNNL